MIDQSKTYRTRDGREVRIYATEGSALEQVHGAVNINGEWMMAKWNSDGHGGWCPSYKARTMSDFDLIESDPHGILPRHRELLASVFGSLKSGDTSTLLALREKPLDELSWLIQAALIALARLDGEKGE